jgi:hypothetical protein
MYARDNKFAYFYDFSIEFWNCFDSLIFIFHFIIGYEKTIMMMYRLNICYMYFNSFLDRQFRGDMAWTKLVVSCIAHQWGLQLIFRNGDTPHPTFEKLEYPYVVKKKIKK